MEHLLVKHSQKQGHAGVGKKSSPSHAAELPECLNGPSCRWLKDNRCNYTHSEQPCQTVHHRKQKKQTKQQPQQQQQEQARPRHHHKNKESADCRNGPSCKFQKQNRCNFSHKKPRHEQKQHVGRQSRGGGQNKNDDTNQLKPCKFGSRCNKGLDCTYLNLPKDFLSSKGGRRHYKPCKMVKGVTVVSLLRQSPSPKMYINPKIIKEKNPLYITL